MPIYNYSDTLFAIYTFDKRNSKNDREINGESNVWSITERSKNLMLMLGLNETIEQLPMTVFIDMLMCCGERTVMS